MKNQLQKATVKNTDSEMENWIFCSRLCDLLRPRHQATLGMLRFLCLRFMHLYYKKCASSSNLTVLSKMLELQLGICLSGLALFTGFFFFLFFLLLSPGGGHSGFFLFFRGKSGRSYCEFYFGFWWIVRQGIWQSATLLCWSMVLKIFLKRSENI